MIRQAFADKPARHRLLAGFVRRIAEGSDADAFVLRGGMLVRHWFPESRRPARDVDLVCRLPHDLRAMRALFARTLARDAADGVEFEADRFRVDPIQTGTAHPGMRLFAVGRASGNFGEISIDTTFAMPIWPDAVRDRLRLGASGEVPFWLCPPEMLVGRKLQVLAQLGPHRWRPKDLSDVWMILRGGTSGALGEAIERAFAGFDHAPLSDLLHGAFWTDPAADVRWSRFVGQLPRGVVPARAPDLVADIGRTLRAFTKT